MRVAADFEFDQDSRGLPQKHLDSTMGVASYFSNIPVDSLAILFTPTGEPSVSRRKAGRGTMGASDEHRVLFAAFRDGCDCVLSGKEWYLSEVMQLVVKSF
jgi:hypothetical protein